MGSLTDFAKSMRQRANRVEPAVAEIAKNAAIAFVTDVAQATPYKSGQAQSNWITSVGDSIQFYKVNADSNSGWQESVDMAKSVLAQYKTLEPIHITNNVPYIAELNRGTSKQAPALFVQLAVARVSYNLRGVRIKL